MPALTFDRFDGGWDVRQLASSADANRLRMLQNAYVTTGRTIRKRPGLRKVGQLPSSSTGLVSALDSLWVFSTDQEKLSIPGVRQVVLSDPNKKGLKRVLHCEVFNGFLYLVAEDKSGRTKHHYIDGSLNTVVTDEHCPHAHSFIKKASKIFAIKDDVVRFSATGNARDWSTAEDAGFLPVALQQSVSNKPVALAEYQKNLVVFFEDSAQIWSVDPNPKLHQFVDTVPIGTRYPYAHANMGADIFFLSPSGFRSIQVQSYSTNLADNDIGSPIDAPVQAHMREGVAPKMLYFRGAGQLLCFVGRQAYVYSFSRSSKISAWSVWSFPFEIDAVAEFETQLYVRSGEGLFVFDDLAFTDNGAPIDVVAELPFLDCRSPGILKQFTGVDVAVSGSLNLSFKFNPMRPEEETQALALMGDSRPLPRIPVEVMATNLGIKAHHNHDGAFELAGITVYYENLSGFAT